MYSLDELKKQNQDIQELCDVLSLLVEKPALHDNPYVCELMQRFKEKVWMHLVFEDNTIYAALVEHNDQAVSDMAKKFHDSAREIKHRFSNYVKHWCKPAKSDAEHLSFLDESRDIFQLIQDRVEFENTHRFPLIEND